MSNAGGVDQYSVNVKVVGEWGRGIDSMRDLGLICRNKLLRPIGIMAASDTLSVFLMSVVPVTFGPIWPWYRTDRHRVAARCLPTPGQKRL